MYHLIWQTQALTQFSALLYYLDITYSPAAGEQLLHEVNRKVALLQSNPLIYRKTKHKVQLYKKLNLRYLTPMFHDGSCFRRGSGVDTRGW